jgi:hypothetical protein
MKFTQGAWLLAIAIPALACLMWGVHKHYEHVRKSVYISKHEFREKYHKSTTADSFLCIVPILGVDRSALKMLNYANQMSSNVVALHIASDKRRASALRKR